MFEQISVGACLRKGLVVGGAFLTDGECDDEACFIFDSFNQTADPIRGIKASSPDCSTTVGTRVSAIFCAVARISSSVIR